MNINIDKYSVIIMPIVYRRINRIYEYIFEELYSYEAAENFIIKIQKKVQILKFLPRIYKEIEYKDEFNRRYRKIVIDNFILLYTIDEKMHIVYILSIHYAKQDYLNNF